MATLYFLTLLMIYNIHNGLVYTNRNTKLRGLSPVIFISFCHVTYVYPLKRRFGLLLWFVCLIVCCCLVLFCVCVFVLCVLFFCSVLFLFSFYFVAVVVSSCKNVCSLEAFYLCYIVYHPRQLERQFESKSSVRATRRKEIKTFPIRR